MSGRTPPSSPRPTTWVEKSQCSTMPGELDHALELQLAPAPADLRRAQGVDQLAGLAAELVGAGGHGAHLLAQPRVGRLALPLDRAQLPLDALQRRRHRVEQLPDGRGAGRGVAIGLGGERGRGLLEPALGERDELLRVVRQRVRRQRGERLLQLDVARGEQLLAAGVRHALALQCGLGGRRRGLRRPQPLLDALVGAAELVEPRAQPAALGPQARGFGAERRRRVGRGPCGVGHRGPCARTRQQPRAHRAEADAHREPEQQHRNNIHVIQGAPGPRQFREARSGQPRSWASNARFTSSPQRNPPSVPSVRTTRWHGTNSAAALRAHAAAAARTAAGRPDLAAYSV